MKKKVMIMISLSIAAISVMFTLFSLFNAYFNLIKPFQQMYLGQQAGDIILNGNRFFQANLIFMAAAIVLGCILTYFAAKISFNQLLERLQKEFDREKRFSAAVAHELKTPLTVVKTNIEFLQLDENPQAADYAETIEVVQKQNERMIQLVQDLSLLSSADVQQKSDLIDMDQMICEIENDLQPSLQLKNIRFEYNKAGFQMKGNAVLMKHAISNLIENAMKYNVTDGEILICQRIENGKYQISVSDTGIGISADDAPYIFEPFYRADQSRNRSTGGSGLGLAIVKEIVEGHSGSVDYQMRKPQGSTFTITLPVN